MYTQCPHCDAIFQVSTAHLKAANGEVRCGQCLTVFNALNHLSDEIPTSSIEQAQISTDDTGSDDPWADDNIVDTSLTESAEENVVTEQVIDNIEPTIDPSLEPESSAIDSEPDTNKLETAIQVPADSADADIFSEVVAEASQHSLPAEEIDRFEEFLSADSPTSVEAEDDLSNELANDFSADDMPLDGEPSDENINNGAAEAVKLGDVEVATAELDAEISIDTADEFAEFDEYQSADNNISETSDVTNGPDFGAEEEAIIIEEADLAPIASKAYTDTPEFNSPDTSKIYTNNSANSNTVATDWGGTQTKAQEKDDFSELAEAAAEMSEATSPAPLEPAVQQPADKPATDETFHIPALIMEDLHAAKAEQLRPSNTPWVIGSLVLMLTLVLQVVYFSRDELAKDASLRPWLIQMCQLTNCTLSQPYDIKQIDIIGREVRSHPSARKALIASTTLINNASFVQPFPLLTVVFADINGKPMAQRRFTPREYLSNNIDLAAGMTPDLPVRIELELVDPGKAAVNYEFHAELDPRNTRPLT